MSFTMPKYVEIPASQTKTIRYIWDDWDVEKADLPLDDAIQKQLLGISHRAVAAFTIGTAEWIVNRFSGLSDDRSPLNYLEAAWAQIVDFGYSDLSDIPMDEWTGPVRGPIGVALRRVKFAVQQAAVSEEPASRAGRAAKLAVHVLPDPAFYVAWRDKLLTRLRTLYPFDPNEKLGEVVPREALDPNFDFQISETETLVNRFLASLSYKANPLLKPPAEMIENGFQGTPYVFNIEQDRKARFEW